MSDIIYWLAAFLVGSGLFAVLAMFGAALVIGIRQGADLLRERRKFREFFERVGSMR